MVYPINAMTIGALALVWNKDGWLDMFIKMSLFGIFLLNAFGAYPTVSQIIKF